MNKLLNLFKGSNLSSAHLYRIKLWQFVSRKKERGKCVEVPTICVEFGAGGDSSKLPHLKGSSEDAKSQTAIHDLLSTSLSVQVSRRKQWGVTKCLGFNLRRATGISSDLVSSKSSRVGAAGIYSAASAASAASHLP